MSQCLIGALIALIPALDFLTFTLSNLLKESKEMIYAGVLSSGVALLQVYSQQNLNPARSNYLYFGRSLGGIVWLDFTRSISK